MRRRVRQVLQTFALPLGDRASVHEAGTDPTSCKLFNDQGSCYFALATLALEAVSFTMGEPIRLPHSVQEPS
jgi:hypothetical protein